MRQLLLKDQKNNPFRLHDEAHENQNKPEEFHGKPLVFATSFQTAAKDEWAHPRRDVVHVKGGTLVKLYDKDQTTFKLYMANNVVNHPFYKVQSLETCEDDAANPNPNWYHNLEQKAIHSRFSKLFLLTLLFISSL